MKKVDATEFESLYASFMKLKKTKKEIDLVCIERKKDASRKNA